MRRSICLAVLVDGFRYDYLNRSDARFFWNMAQTGIDACVRETYAFQLRPAFFAGLHPEECDIANLYCFNPESSPFKDLPFDRYDRRSIHRYIREKEALQGYSATRHIADIAEIPESFLPYFDFSEKHLTTDPKVFPGHDSLFDVMKEHGKNWLWIAYPTDDQRVEAILNRFDRCYSTNLDFVYLHFAELDWVGHENGPHSAEQKRQLREIDRAVEKVYQRLCADFEEVRLVVFGDHGMVKVTECCNIEEQLADSGLKAPDDYLYFLDSTQARFWFFREGAREKVTRLLEKSPYGHILLPADLERLRSRFFHNRFGELIFAVNNGVILFPNFFQRENPCRGMHGYLPEVEANWARLLVHGFGEHGRMRESVSMVSLFPTFLDLLDLPVPKTCSAPSVFQLLERERGRERQTALDLSVIIPTCNRRESLARVLHGLVQEGGCAERYEIIVVDDGSTDGTGETIDAISRSSSVPIVSVTQENRGPAAARNRGARLARGPILLFLGDDTLPERNLVTEHLRRQRELRSCAVLGHTVPGERPGDLDFAAFVHIPYGANPATTSEFLCRGAQFDYSRIDDIHDLHWGYFFTSNISLPAALFREAGGFDEEFTEAAYEDSELGYRLWQRGMRLVFHQDAVVRHEHPQDYSSFMARQFKAGKGAVIFWKKHPELWQPLGFDELLNKRFVHRFYDAGLRYNYLAGALFGMGIEVPARALPGTPETADIGPLLRLFKENVGNEIARLRSAMACLEQRAAHAETEAATLREARDAAVLEKEAASARSLSLQLALDRYRKFVEHAGKITRAGGPAWVWGCGAGGQRVAAVLDALGFPWRGFIDSNPRRCGTPVRERPVMLPEVLNGAERVPVIVASSFADEICEKLTKLGYVEGRDFLVAPLDALTE